MSGGPESGALPPRDRDPEVDRLLAEAPAGRQGRRDALVGLLVLVALLSIVTALLLFTDAALFRGRYHVTAVVEDAGGLRRGDPVRMRGVNVGRVRAFDFGQDGVRIRLEIDGQYRPPADSRVLMRSSGVLGGMIVEIVPGVAPVALRGGAEIPGASEEPLTRTAVGLGESAGEVLARIEGILADPTGTSLRRGAAALDTLLRTLSTTARSEGETLAAIGGDVRAVTAELRAATGEGRVPELLGRSDSILARLERSAVSLERSSAALELMLTATARGEGTAGLLATDERLYEELVRAARAIAVLSEDVRENPGRYVSVRIF